MSWLLKGLAIGAAIGLAAVAIVGTGGLAAAAIVGGLAAGGAGVGEMLSTMSWASKEIVGKIAVGSGNVCISKRRAARAHLDTVICSKHSGALLLATGSSTVLINGWPATRVEDKTACGAVITEGATDVFIGGDTVQTDIIHPEDLVPGWVHAGLLLVGLGSAVILAGPIVALVGLAGGFVGGSLGNLLGGWAFGEGSDGQKWSLLLGSFVGGFFGAKGGNSLVNKFIPTPTTSTQAFMRGGVPGVQKFVGPRATGEGAFPNSNTQPYDPEASGKILHGQNNDASCVAGSCKMLMNDRSISEAELRVVLKIDHKTGGYVRDIPAALKEYCLPDALYDPELPLGALQSATQKNSAVVSIRSPTTGGAHAVVVDGFEDGFVLIRDPWPPGLGSAYKLPIADFEAAYTGKAVTLP